MQTTAIIKRQCFGTAKSKRNQSLQEQDIWTAEMHLKYFLYGRKCKSHQGEQFT